MCSLIGCTVDGNKQYLHSKVSINERRLKKLDSTGILDSRCLPKAGRFAHFPVTVPMCGEVLKLRLDLNAWASKGGLMVRFSITVGYVST